MIQREAKKDDLHEDDLKKHFPSFLWLLRDGQDFDMPKEGEHQLTPTEYLKNRVLVVKDENTDDVSSRVKRALMTLFPSLECETLPRPSNPRSPELDHEFIESIEGSIQTILSQIKPKQGYKDNVPPNGSVLAELAKQYVDALNSNTVPNLENSWMQAIYQDLRQFAERLEVEYEREMNETVRDKFPMEQGIIAIPPELGNTDFASGECTLMSYHWSILGRKYKKLRDQINYLMPTIPSTDPAATGLQDQKLMILDKFQSQLVTIQNGRVHRGLLLPFINDNLHLSEILCAKIFDEVYSTGVQQSDQLRLDHLEREYSQRAIGPAKQQVLEQKLIEIPEPPTDLKKSYVTHNQLSLTWSSPCVHHLPAKSYDVELWHNSELKCTITNTLPPTEMKHLRPNTLYSLRIRGCNGLLKGEFSEFIDVRTMPGVPDKPAKPEIASELPGMVQLTVQRLPKEKHNGSPVNKLIIESKIDSESKWVTTKDCAVTNKSGDDKPITVHVPLPGNVCTKLYYRVAMANGAGTSESSEISNLPVTNLFPDKADFMIDENNDIHARQIKLTWNPPTSNPGSVTHYSVRMKAGNGGWMTVEKHTRTSYDFNELKPATVYTFQVACCNEKHKGGWSKEIKVKTKPDRPDIPQIIHIKFEGKKDYFIIVKKPSKEEENGSSINSIVIETNENDSDNWIRKIAPIRSGLQSLFSNKQFKEPINPICKSNSADSVLNYRVRFVNVAGESAPSNVVQLPVTKIYPNKPTNFHIAEIEARKVKLCWSVPDINPASAMYYQVELKQGDDNWKVLSDRYIDNCYTVGSLLPATTYSFRVASCNEEHTGEYIILEGITTKPGRPERPTSKPELHLEFSRKEKRYSLSVQRPPKKDENGSPVSKVIVEKSSNDDPQWSHSEHRVEAGDKPITIPISPFSDKVSTAFFHYRVCFINEGGMSDASDVLQIPVENLYPESPKEFHVVNISARNVSLQWNAPAVNSQSVTFYLVERSQDNSNSIAVSNKVKSDVTSYTFDGLTPATSYSFQVTSCNSTHPIGGCLRIDNIETEPDVPNSPTYNPYISIEPNILEHNSSTYNLVVKMPSKGEDNGSTVKTVVVESKQQGDSGKCQQEDFPVACDHSISRLPIIPPNATSPFVMEYRIRMKNEVGCSEPSKFCHLHASQMIPGPPKNLRTCDNGVQYNKITLIWDEPDTNPISVEYYCPVKIDESRPFHWSNVLQNVLNTQERMAVFENLSPNTKYKFGILAVNKDSKHCKQLCDKIEVSTGPCPPKKPEYSQIILKVIDEHKALLTVPLPDYNETGSKVHEMRVIRLNENMEHYSSLRRQKVPEDSSGKVCKEIQIDNETHFIRVQLINGVDKSDFSVPVGVAASDLKPGIPKCIQQKKSTTRSVTMSWNTPELHARAAKRYKIKVKHISDGGWKDPIDPVDYSLEGLTHTATLKDLTPLCKYEVSICAVNENVFGEFSEPIVLETVAGKPDPPPAPTINRIDTNTAELGVQHRKEGDNGAPVEQVLPEWSSDNRDWKPCLKNNDSYFEVNPTSDVFHFNAQLQSALDPNSRYYFRVKMKNKLGESSPSDILELPLALLRPGPVLKNDAGVTQIEAHSANLEWKCPDIHPAVVNKYIIEEQLGESEWKSVQTYDTKPLQSPWTATIKSLKSNAIYTFRVIAVSESGKMGTPEVFKLKTAEIVPSAPLSLRVDRRRNNQVKVCWNKPEGDPEALHYYKLEVFEERATEPIYICTLKSTRRSKVIKCLKPSTNYSIAVTAMNEDKMSREDNKSRTEITFKTKVSDAVRGFTSVLLGIPTLGLGGAAFYYASSPDSESYMVDSGDEEGSCVDEDWPQEVDANNDNEFKEEADRKDNRNEAQMVEANIVESNKNALQVEVDEGLPQEDDNKAHQLEGNVEGEQLVNNEIEVDELNKMQRQKTDPVVEDQLNEAKTNSDNELVQETDYNTVGIEPQISSETIEMDSLVQHLCMVRCMC